MYCILLKPPPLGTLADHRENLFWCFRNVSTEPDETRKIGIRLTGRGQVNMRPYGGYQTRKIKLIGRCRNSHENLFKLKSKFKCSFFCPVNIEFRGGKKRVKNLYEVYLEKLNDARTAITRNYFLRLFGSTWVSFSVLSQKCLDQFR